MQYESSLSDAPQDQEPLWYIAYSFAMAEMTTLLATLYKHYTTCEQERQKGSSPTISSRFELFYDERFERITPKYRVLLQEGL
ncbi:hypothetical protein PspLS_09435 [Pyricularia sp. CBS 133598]|nr:hypothetical protein PspLS_09435 [Pyricularia sp. CBS 133598]